MIKCEQMIERILALRVRRERLVERIKSLRANGMTQVKIATELGIAQDTVSRILRGNGLGGKVAE